MNCARLGFCAMLRQWFATLAPDYRTRNGGSSAFARFIIRTVFNEMIASAGKAQTFVENASLQLYPAAEV